MPRQAAYSCRRCHCARSAAPLLRSLPSPCMRRCPTSRWNGDPKHQRHALYPYPDQWPHRRLSGISCWRWPAAYDPRRPLPGNRRRRQRRADLDRGGPATDYRYSQDRIRSIHRLGRNHSRHRLSRAASIQAYRAGKASVVSPTIYAGPGTLARMEEVPSSSPCQGCVLALGFPPLTGRHAPMFELAVRWEIVVRSDRVPADGALGARVLVPYGKDDSPCCCTMRGPWIWAAGHLLKVCDLGSVKVARSWWKGGRLRAGQKRDLHAAA